MVSQTHPLIQAGRCLSSRESCLAQIARALPELTEYKLESLFAHLARLEEEARALAKEIQLGHEGYKYYQQHRGYVGDPALLHVFRDICNLRKLTVFLL